MKKSKYLSMFLLLFAALLFFAPYSADANFKDDNSSPVLKKQIEGLNFVTSVTPVLNYQSSILNLTDTTLPGYTSYNVGKSINFDFTLDSISTEIMISNNIDLTEFYGKTICVSWYYIDTAYSLAANSDTSRAILQGLDDFGNIASADTLGSGNAGAEILVSTGTLQMSTVTLYKYYPRFRFYIKSLVTGAHKNGYGRLQLCIWYLTT